MLGNDTFIKKNLKLNLLSQIDISATKTRFGFILPLAERTAAY